MRFTQLKNGEGFQRGVINIICAGSGTSKIMQQRPFHDGRSVESRDELSASKPREARLGDQQAANGREPNIGLSDSPAK